MTGRASSPSGVVQEPTGSLAGKAYEHIKTQLVTLQIRPGDPIDDEVLAHDLAIGRTPIREALKRLETDFLVVSYPRRGTFATRVDVTELGAISDLRQQLEPHAARRAAENATPRMRIEMQTSAEAIRHLRIADGNYARFIREDTSVHQLIYRAAQNRHLEDVLLRYGNLATRIWCLVIDKLPQLGDHVREHHVLLQAIVDGEAELAASLALAHVTSFDAAIRQVL